MIKLVFGTGNIVSHIFRKENAYFFSMEKIENAKPIGYVMDPTERSETPDVEMRFNNIESLNVVIEMLIKLRDAMLVDKYMHTEFSKSESGDSITLHSLFLKLKKEVSKNNDNSQERIDKE